MGDLETALRACKEIGIIRNRISRGHQQQHALSIGAQEKNKARHGVPNANKIIPTHISPGDLFRYEVFAETPADISGSRETLYHAWIRVPSRNSLARNCDACLSRHSQKNMWCSANHSNQRAAVSWMDNIVKPYQGWLQNRPTHKLLVKLDTFDKPELLGNSPLRCIKWVLPLGSKCGRAVFQGPSRNNHTTDKTFSY